MTLGKAFLLDPFTIPAALLWTLSISSMRREKPCANMGTCADGTADNTQIYHSTVGTHLAWQDVLQAEKMLQAQYMLHTPREQCSVTAHCCDPEKGPALRTNEAISFHADRKNRFRTRLYVNTLKRLFMPEHNFAKFLLKFSSFSFATYHTCCRNFTNRFAASIFRNTL